MVTADRQGRSAHISPQLLWGGVYETSMRDRRWIGALMTDPAVALEAGASSELRTRFEDDWAGRKPLVVATGRWAGNVSC